MADEDSSEELIDGPRSSEIVQWGGATGTERTRDNYQMGAFFNAQTHKEGMIWHINRRPRRGRMDEPGPHTVRVMQPNPNGMIWQLMQKRKVVMRTRAQDKARQIDILTELEQKESGRREPRSSE